MVRLWRRWRSRKVTISVDTEAADLLLGRVRVQLDALEAHEAARADRGEGHLVPPLWIAEAKRFYDSMDAAAAGEADAEG